MKAVRFDYGENIPTVVSVSLNFMQIIKYLKLQRIFQRYFLPYARS
jgi:hypothetical protein